MLEMLVKNEQPEVRFLPEPANKRDENAIVPQAKVALHTNDEVHWGAIGYVPGSKVPKVTLALRNNELKVLSLKNVFYQYVDALGQFKYFPVLLPRRLASGPDYEYKREAKKFMKDEFTSWYSAQIQGQLDSGVVLDDVDVDLRLSVLKPIHATWIVSMYNHLSSSEGRQSIAKGWKKAGVTDVVSGSKKLPPEDPFEDLDV